MARSKKRRARKKVAPPAPEKPFAFMSLPPEIRLMVYDALLPTEKEVCLNRKPISPPETWPEPFNYPQLTPDIKALLQFKVIRSELAYHLFTRLHFKWTDSWITAKNTFWGGCERWPFYRSRWESFKRHAMPFIVNFSFWVDETSMEFRHSNKLFLSLLKWMRWRGLRSHLYPWHLKNLTLVEANRTFRLNWGRMTAPSTAVRPHSHGNSFLLKAPVVPGLDSLHIVLKRNPGAEAAKDFLERCASCGVEGKIGHWETGQGRITYWIHLQDDQLIRTTV